MHFCGLWVTLVCHASLAVNAIAQNFACCLITCSGLQKLSNRRRFATLGLIASCGHTGLKSRTFGLPALFQIGKNLRASCAALANGLVKACLKP